MHKVQVPMNAPYSVTGVNMISLTREMSRIFPTWELTAARNRTTSLNEARPHNSGAQGPRPEPPSRATDMAAALTHRGWS